MNSMMVRLISVSCKIDRTGLTSGLGMYYFVFKKLQEVYLAFSIPCRGKNKFKIMILCQFE